MGFYDVMRAHFHSDARRTLYIIPPPEDTSVRMGCALLLKTLYVPKDAGQCFDAKSESMMRASGFDIGVFSPCIRVQNERHCICFRHGDDYALLGTREDQEWFMKESQKQLLMKCLGVLGPDRKRGDVQEIRVLNRLLRYVQPAFQPESIMWNGRRTLDMLRYCCLKQACQVTRPRLSAHLVSRCRGMHLSSCLTVQAGHCTGVW